jgi:preprotein translocase subunit SecE
MEQIRRYITESYNELVNKVSWPSWPSLISSTRVVIGASIVITLIIFLMDAVAKQLTTIIYSI